MSKIFMSYSRADEAFARRLATYLSGVGAEIWLDVKNIPPGMNWSTAIQQGLDSAEIMILIMTPEAADSENVTNEWQYFLDEHKPIIPVLLKPHKVHFQLRRMQYLDFHTRKFEDATQQLHSELRHKGLRLSTSSLTPAPPKQPANLPEQRQKPNEMVEEILKSVGVDPKKARLDNIDAGYGWSFQRGSAIIETYVTFQAGTEMLQVLSPLIYLPTLGDSSNLYRRLLELNLQLTGAALGIYLDVIYLFFELPTSSLTSSGFNTAITSIAAYGDDLDDKLVKEFGGRLYSSSPSPSK